MLFRSCNSIRSPNEDLWHQRMGHASYKHLSIVSKLESMLGIPKLSRMSKRTMKVMETVNVVINESLDSISGKGIEELTKVILPLEPREFQKIVEQEPASPTTLGTPSVMEDSVDITTSPNSESHEEKGPSSRIKLNHPLEDCGKLE